MISTFLFLMQMSCPEHAMGFSQTATKHTFRLFKDGGAIEVRVLDANDAATLEMVRHHLQTIANDFAEGDFAKPEAVHDRLPDGAAAMKELRADIKYQYVEIPSGGRVLIRTTNGNALSAVHQFLRFQIREHKTRDSVEVTSE
ncbi:MAG TPA: hypothetical protein VKL19_01750 [Thermoanaerobaculia bacterium]|nr:hypothetical protein [Thermoanaerobaculia bacterium]